MTEAGQSEADFGQEAAAYLDGLYSYAMSLWHNQAAAEDLVEQTYLRATQAFGQLPPDSNLKNWLYAIARNIWMNQLHHTRAGAQFVEIEDEQEAGAPFQSSDNPHTRTPMETKWNRRACAPRWRASHAPTAR